ncbi:hypothetical protein GGF43_006517 [Coemansia sp. RSA 2618]|nr:hypothetical protein GGF43_006517 [Coemansia sp. RSA 2618]
MQASSPHPRRRVKQLSSVRAWCQSNGMDIDAGSESELASYESFPDLRRLLEEECAEIERRESEAKATLEARMRRRNSDSLSDASSSSSVRSGSELGGSGPGFIGSLYRFIGATSGGNSPDAKSRVHA